jgi:hypothetical protein
VRPARRASFAAAYLPQTRQLLVNPVWLIVADPDPTEDAAAFAAPVSLVVASNPVIAVAPPDRALEIGNPYSFFGSVGECAAAERLRCETCLPASSCVAESRDASDGNAECTQLGEGDGLGYFLFCANLALAIDTVSQCAQSAAPQCGGVVTASNQLAALDANRNFVEDMTCRGALDACLTKIYGEPSDDYPVPTDAGPAPPPPPPRDVTPACGDNDVNCDFSPQCDNTCSDPDCDQSLQCNNTCSGDTSCQGCGDDGCGSSDDSGGSSGCGSSEGGGGGCGSGDSSSNSSSCGSDDSSSGSGCDSCSSDSSGDGSSCDNSCGSGDSGGGSCGSCGSDSGGGGSCGGSGGSCGGGGGGGSCGGGGGGGSCNVTPKRGPRVHSGVLVGITVLWALIPLPLLEFLRRRERARRKRRAEHGSRGDA